MFIRTERLFLRPGWPEDLQDLVKAMTDDAFVRSVGIAWIPSSDVELRKYLSQPREGPLPHFFIYLREDDHDAKLIGGIGLGRSEADVELGYWIGAAHRGRGYAAEALRAVLEQASLLGHRQVVAADFADNDASARVLEQSGFKPTGETRQRFSFGRGGEAPIRRYVADLTDTPCDTSSTPPRSAAI